MLQWRVWSIIGTNNSETYHKTPKGWESEQTVRKKQIENLKMPFCATHLCSDTLLRFDKKGNETLKHQRWQPQC